LYHHNIIVIHFHGHFYIIVMILYLCNILAIFLLYFTM